MSNSPRPNPRDDSNDDDSFEIVRFDDVHDGGESLRPIDQADPRDTRGHQFDGFGDRKVGRLRSDAFLTLEAMRTGGTGVKMIDVVQVVCERPLYTLQRWRCERTIGETVEMHARRSVYLAEDFIATYPDTNDGSHLYVIFAANEEEVRRVV